MTDDGVARARALVASLTSGEASSEDVFAAFAELDEIPPEIVREELAAWLGPAADPERLDDATRRAHGMPPRPLHLSTLSVARDADVLFLGDVAEAQLRFAGKCWDGADLEPEERLDGEVDGSFAGTLEHRVLADAEAGSKAAPLYDVLRYAGDSGVVFHAGTAKVAGMIADGRVETKDRRVRTAIEECLAREGLIAPEAPSMSEAPTLPDVPTVSAAPSLWDAPTVAAVPSAWAAEEEPEPVTIPRVAEAPAAKVKKASAKKSTAKKSTAKKTAAKKTTAAEKMTAKKTAAKKTTAKKTAAKKSTAKKTTAKKTAPESDGDTAADE